MQIFQFTNIKTGSTPYRICYIYIYIYIVILYIIYTIRYKNSKIGAPIY